MGRNDSMQIPTLSAYLKFGDNSDRRFFMKKGLHLGIIGSLALWAHSLPERSPDLRNYIPYNVLQELKNKPSDQYTAFDAARLAKLLTQSPHTLESHADIREGALSLMKEKVIINSNLSKNVRDAAQRLVQAYGTDLEKLNQQYSQRGKQLGKEDLLIDTFYQTLPYYMTLRQAVQNQALAAARSDKKSA